MPFTAVTFTGVLATTTYSTNALLPALYGVQVESHTTTIPNPSYTLRSTPTLADSRLTLFFSTKAWLENVTFQMNTMSKEEQNMKLGGHIALLKLSSSRVAEFCASSAMQVRAFPNHHAPPTRLPILVPEGTAIPLTVYVIHVTRD